MEPLAYCRGLALAPGASLRLTLPFAPSAQRERLIVLYALLAELGRIPDTVSEPGVAQVKLGWWRQQLIGDAESRAQHPILVALTEQELLERLEPQLLERLLTGIQSTMDPPVRREMVDFIADCADLGGTAARLELAAIDGQETTVTYGPALDRLGAGRYLARLLRDIRHDAGQGRWWMPRAVQARFGASAAAVAAGNAGDDESAAVAWLAAQAGEMMADGIAALPVALRARQVHLLCQTVLDQRLAAYMARRPALVFQQRLRTGPVGDLWTVWRQARRSIRAAYSQTP